ncbi:Esterase PHB depolymerase [Fontimonas thermophila]|uniref:Esterase PHB depolymerase n=1 Tax=Fontimonas thermophila TaxID=1076937 RepID=A0A1I2HRH7_9GAMM|nr:PHB depolymerase family esterase [Fontimonas thermophila]SFF32744.1 Esterase PHB depolymerase [Fontimonas thermophila]
MRTSVFQIASVATLGILLAACGGSDTPAEGSALRGGAVPPVPAQAAGCAGIHGNPPAELTHSPSALPGTLSNLAQYCTLRGGEVLTWSDGDGTPRQACLYVPAQASAQTPLPLVVFLQGSIFPADQQVLVSQYDTLYETADLTGDPNRPGFILLVPQGRDTAHHYPFPDDTGLGWDNWYRNFDRSDPAINRDVQTIDHFIAEVKARGIVDPRRIYMTGWSNGAAMAILYGLNTPGIAATAVYSSPDPFVDIADPCAQPPFGNNLRPIMTVHNDCDIVGICTTGSEGFRERITRTMPQLEYRAAIIDLQQQEVAACDASCTYDGTPVDALSPGAVRHLIWPTQWNARMFQFLRERALPE